MSATITVTLPDEAREEWLREASEVGQSAEEFLAGLFRRRRAVRRLRELQPVLETAAHTAGWNSPEDVFRDVS